MYPVVDAGAAHQAGAGTTNAQLQQTKVMSQRLEAGAAVLTSCRRHCCWRCCQLNPRPKRGHSPVENLTDYLNSCTYHLLTEGNGYLQQQLKKFALLEPNVLQRKHGAAIAAGAGATYPPLPLKLCCQNSGHRVRRCNVSAAATAVCECDDAQRLCCRNSSERV